MMEGFEAFRGEYPSIWVQLRALPIAAFLF
jgi:hypothetical protein